MGALTLKGATSSCTLWKYLFTHFTNKVHHLAKQNTMYVNYAKNNNFNNIFVLSNEKTELSVLCRNHI